MSTVARKPFWLRTLASARSTFESSLHPLRRSLARGRLRQRGLLRSVYFVCEGNIYRSPFAAAAFASALPAPLAESIRIGSDGFVGPGRTSPAEAVEAARRFGVDLTPHRSAQLHPSVQEDWDLFVVMEPRQARALMRAGVSAERIVVLGDLDPLIPSRRTIADPWQRDVQVLGESYRRIDRCIRELARVGLGLPQPTAIRSDSAERAASS